MLDKILVSLWTSLRREGLFQTVKKIPSRARVVHPRVLYNDIVNRRLDRKFDEVYGVRTCDYVELNDLSISSVNKKEGVLYAPTPIRDFEESLRFADSLDLSQYTFIDVGSGKGRIMMLALMKGFGQVVGVDFSPELCKTAEKNLAVFSGAYKINGNYKVVCQDILEFDIPDGDIVIFMYNPFFGSVMVFFIENILSWKSEFNRDIFLVYLNPFCSHVVDESGFFKKIESGSGVVLPYSVYRGV